jgi:hypothetical protein
MTAYRDANKEVRAIVDGAIAQLIALGMTPDGAATLLAIQGSLRLDEPHQLQELRTFVDETLALFGEEPAEVLH